VTKITPTTKVVSQKYPLPFLKPQKYSHKLEEEEKSEDSPFF
jgi:hypothetical protein